MTVPLDSDVGQSARRDRGRKRYSQLHRLPVMRADARTHPSCARHAGSRARQHLRWSRRRACGCVCAHSASTAGVERRPLPSTESTCGLRRWFRDETAPGRRRRTDRGTGSDARGPDGFRPGRRPRPACGSSVRRQSSRGDTRRPDVPAVTGHARGGHARGPVAGRSWRASAAGAATLRRRSPRQGEKPPPNPPRARCERVGFTFARFFGQSVARAVRAGSSVLCSAAEDLRALPEHARTPRQIARGFQQQTKRQREQSERSPRKCPLRTWLPRITRRIGAQF